MSEIHYRYYIGQGPEAQALIDKARAENKAEYDQAEALAHEYGAQTVICRGEKVYGLFYPEKKAERWLRYEQPFKEGHIYVPDKRTTPGKELARRLDVFRRRTCSDRILDELGMASIVLGAKNGRGIMAESVAGFDTDTGIIVLKVPYSEGKEHKLPASPSWLRPCKESEFLAARSAALAKATCDMRARQQAYFKYRGNVLLAEAKQAEADVDRLLAEIFPAPKQGQLF